MSEYNAKNYIEQGGDVIHIGGKIVIEDGASVEGLPGGSDLPDVTSADNGKVLGVTEGEWGKVDVPTELPAVTSSDNGKVLGVTEGEWGKVDVPTELPAVTSSDNGKLLGVSDGEWGKVDAPSGGALPVKTIVVTGTTLALNVSVTFPQGFNRSEIERYADGPREYILQVQYGPSITPRKLQFEGFDGTYAVFTLLEYGSSSEPVFILTVVYIAYMDNPSCKDKAYVKMIPIAG